MSVEDIIAEGDKVWVRMTETGTHTGKYRGLVPTGNKMTFLCVDIFRIVDGKVSEAWHVYDFLDFYKQLGVIDHKGFSNEASLKRRFKELLKTGSVKCILKYYFARCTRLP